MPQNLRFKGQTFQEKLGSNPQAATHRTLLQVLVCGGDHSTPLCEGCGLHEAMKDGSPETATISRGVHSCLINPKGRFYLQWWLEAFIFFIVFGSQTCLVLLKRQGGKKTSIRILQYRFSLKKSLQYQIRKISTL